MEERLGRWRQTLLVVDPEEVTRQRMRTLLASPEREVLAASTAAEALHAIPQVQPDLLLVSMELPDLRGVRALEIFQERAPGVPVIALSGEPGIGPAVDALRHGAHDYLGATVSQSIVLDVVVRALKETRSTRDLEKARQQVADRYGFSQLLTRSPRMVQVFDQIQAVAPTDATVLIRGETGTGKELVSRAIHERSRRREQPFISVNCGAFTETLLESELFGHEKGSFTGAAERRQGLFEMADGGTLFLDELGETTLNVQVNLLRVLEEMSFRRVGGRDQVQVDVRIVAATNVALEEAVERREFREDLYYRLNVFPILLPPLRERREDVPLLMRHFLDEIAADYGLDPPVVAAEALEAITSYRWPGNVRQLRSMCERWVITRNGQRLEVDNLPPDVSGRRDPGEVAGGLQVDDEQPMKWNTDRAADQIERAYLVRVLRRFEGHLGQTADHAGISRRTLYTKMKQFGLDARDFRRA